MSGYTSKIAEFGYTYLSILISLQNYFLLKYYYQVCIPLVAKLFFFTHRNIYWTLKNKFEIQELSFVGLSIVFEVFPPVVAQLIFLSSLSSMMIFSSLSSLMILPLLSILMILSSQNKLMILNSNRIRKIYVGEKVFNFY